MISSMKLFRNRRATLQDLEDSLAQIPDLVKSALPSRYSRVKSVATTAAWITAGVAVVSLGMVAGRELRIRYKLKRRSPYDYYAHAGDRRSDLEFGVGI